MTKISGFGALFHCAHTCQLYGRAETALHMLRTGRDVICVGLNNAEKPWLDKGVMHAFAAADRAGMNPRTAKPSLLKQAHMVGSLL